MLYLIPVYVYSYELWESGCLKQDCEMYIKPAFEFVFAGLYLLQYEPWLMMNDDSWNKEINWFSALLLSDLSYLWKYCWSIEDTLETKTAHMV